MFYPVPRHPVRFEQEGNPLYPLPKDYEDLAPEYQRQARVNALCLQDTPEDMVTAWCCLKEWYLKTLPPDVWYIPPFHESPPAHYAMIYDIARYPRNIFGFPRGFGKSLLKQELGLLWALTRPFFSMLWINSVDPLIVDQVSKLMYQIESNENIIRDFGELKGERGSSNWSAHYLRLANGFKLLGRTVTGQLLGFRPRCLWLDDAEFDPQMNIVKNYLTDQLEATIINHMLPQLTPGSIMVMSGTLLSRRSLLYRMANTPVSQDPRLAFWNRAIYGLLDSNGESIWPERYTPEIIQGLRDQYLSAFYAQFLNEPAPETERTLPVHPRLAAYCVVDESGEPVDHTKLENPLACDHLTLIVWKLKGTNAETGELEYDEIKQPFGTAVASMQRFLMADPRGVGTAGPHSDDAAVVVVGRWNTPQFRDTLFVLEVFAKPLDNTRLIQKIWEMGRLWRVRLVGVEALSLQSGLEQTIASDFAVRSEVENWMPRVEAISYQRDLLKSKGQRIGNMTWRFEQNRIKFPLWMETAPHWSKLLQQIRDFTEDGGLLDHDDLIDALSMYHYLVRPSSGYVDNRGTTRPQTAMEFLEAGIMYYPGTSLPVAAGINASDLTMKAYDALHRQRMTNYERERHQRDPRYGPLVQLGH